MSELQKRVITALVLIVLAVVWAFVVSQKTFVLLTALIGFAISLELFRLMKLSPYWFYMLVSALVFSLLIQVDIALSWVVIVLMALWLIPFLQSSAQTVREDQTLYRILSTLFMMVWLLAFVWSLIHLHATDTGVKFLCGCFLGIWASDSGAYFVGKKWGQTKLCPSISPGKSWEGFAGGMLVGVALAGGFWMISIDLSWVLALALAIALIVLGVLGDLLESALKRSVGAKDSGTILPGHGGLLDRLDSLITAVPLTTALWMLSGA